MLCWCLTIKIKITSWQLNVNPPGRRERGSHYNWSSWFVCFSGFTATLSRAVLKAEAHINTLIIDQPSLVTSVFLKSPQIGSRARLCKVQLQDVFFSSPVWCKD